MAVRTLAPRLVALGVRTTLVSVYADGLSPQERVTLEAAGVAIETIGRANRADIGFLGRLVATLRRLGPDVVHGHVHAGKYAGRAAAIAARVPSIVYTAHGEYTIDGIDAYRPLERLGNSLLNPQTKRFITFTSAQRDGFARAEGITSERIVVLPNGVPVPPACDRAATRAEIGLPPEALALYMPARLAAVKAHALAIDAVASLGARAASWHLVFAGAGAEEGAIRDRVRSRGLENRTHVLGFRSDAASLAAAMDLFLLPSLQERMPLALGEAMHSSLPVVTAPWEGVSDFVQDGETGYVAAAGDTPAFAEALVRAVADSDRAVVAARARELAARTFDVERWARDHVSLYTALT